MKWSEGRTKRFSDFIFLIEYKTPKRTEVAVFFEIFSTMISEYDILNLVKLSKIKNLCSSEQIIRGLLNFLGSFNPNNVCSKILYLELNGNFKNCFGLLLVESGHNLDQFLQIKL